MTVTIDELPGPHGIPVLGNLLDIDTHSPIEGFMVMAREYGPIFRLTMPGGGPRLIVSGADLVEEICDDTRFDKQVGPGLRQPGGPTQRGLFTSDTSDPLWRRAHNILMAPFSQQAMREYMPRMLDIAGQLTDKWSRLNPDDEVNVPQDMTALTLDTIALCGFDYRFNSFYRDTPHPFVAAMVRTLVEQQKEARELPLQRKLRIQARRQLREDQEFMASLVKALMADRRQRGDAADNTDLLGRMLTGVDKQSGEKLPDENIVAQCITFLVAGHETTSGLLSFAIYYLLKNPEYAARAQGRGRRGAGRRRGARLRAGAHVSRTSARCWTSRCVCGRRRRCSPECPRQDTVVAGKYAFPQGLGVSVLTPDAAPGPERLGRGRRGVRPRPFRAGADQVRAADGVPAVRHRPAGVHRAPVRPAGGDARPRHAAAAVRVRRSSELPAAHARRRSPSSPMTSGSRSVPAPTGPLRGG